MLAKHKNLLPDSVCGMTIGVVAWLVPVLGLCADLQTIDDLAFGAVMDDKQFSRGLSLQNLAESTLELNKSNQPNMSIEVEFTGKEELSLKPFEDFSHGFTMAEAEGFSSKYTSQGLQVKRLSTSIDSGAGILTVGRDWANFQEILKPDENFNSAQEQNDQVVNQIKWTSPNGFTIALEDTATENLDIQNDSEHEAKGSPSIILSWQSGPEGAIGEYRVAAMGTRLDAENSGQNFDGKDVISWGLNLQGGWQLGDLFTALSVTYGKGIKSFILQRLGDELLITADSADELTDAYSIRPSLYYTLNEYSKFHVVLEYFSADDPSDKLEVETLDTIHMGYSWSPWPSTRFGLELFSKKSDGAQGELADKHILFSGEKQF